MGKRKTRKGKRTDLDGVYFRSAWEANYARYLNFLIKQQCLYKWEYETCEFEFPVKRGRRFYLPDFKIWERRNSEPYFVEIKGYMDQVSRTKLKRMKKYYPEIRVDLVQAKQYYEIKKKLSKAIPNWE